MSQFVAILFIFLLPVLAVGIAKAISYVRKKREDYTIEPKVQSLSVREAYLQLLAYSTKPINVNVNQEESYGNKTVS